MSLTRRVMLLGLLAAPRAAWAIFGVGDITIVSDPSGLIQQTFSAARSLRSNLNEAAQLTQQAQSYLQDGKSFISGPLETFRDLQATIGQYNDVLMQGADISFQLQSAVQQFDALYASGWNGNISLMQRAQQMLGTIRAAGQMATKTQAVYDRLTKSKDTTTRLLAASQAAPGSLAAEQANGQLLAQMIDQQGQLLAMQAAAEKFKVAYMMKETVEDEAVQARAASWLQGWPTGAVPVRVMLPGH